MKQALLFAALLTVVLSSCSRGDTIDPATSLDGTWRMITVKDNVTGQLTTKPPSVQGNVEITFTSTSPSIGTFTGNTPTNDIWINPYSTGTNSTISIPVLAMTKVAETSWGNEFVQHIITSLEYSFAGNGNLSIKTTSKTLTFRKL